MTVAFGNSNTILAQASGNPLSGAKTVNAGSNLCAIAYIVWNDVNEGITITGVTYNSVAMTSMGARVRVGTTNLQYIQGWYLAGPATGSNTLAVTFSNGNAIDQGAVLLAYTGVDQTTPLRGGSYTSFSGLTAADGKKLLAISSATDDRTISASGNNDHAPLSSQTIETSDTAGAAFLGTDDAAGAATVNHTWDTVVVSANQIALLGASLAAAGASTPDLPTVSDTATVTEAQTMNVKDMPSVFNTVTVDDATLRLLIPLYAQVNEAITIVDAQALSGLVVPPGPAPNINDAVTVAESRTASLLSDDPFRQAAAAPTGQVTLPLTTRRNNALAVFVRWQSAAITLDTVTDTNGNTYTLIQNPVTLGSGVRAAAAVAIDQVGGVPLTIFANFSSTPSGIWMAAHEVTQRDLLAPVDGSAGQAQNLPSGTDAVSSGPFTTTRDGAYIFGGSTEAGAGAVTDPGTGFLERTRDLPVTVGFITEDTVQSSAGSVSATFTGEAPGIAYATIGLALQYARFWLPSLSEAISVVESSTVMLPLMPVISDAVTVNESVTLLERPAQFSVFDAVILTESVAVNVATFPGLTISVFDTVLLEGPPAPVIHVSDAVTVSEIVIVQPSGVQVADTVTITEAVTVNVTLRINAFDQILLVIMAETADTVTLTESVAITFATFSARQINVNEANVFLTESVGVQFHPMQAVVNELVTVTDAPALVPTPLRVVSSDAVALIDQPTAALITNISITTSDAVTVTENTLLALHTAAQLAIALADSVTVTESATILGAPNVTVNDPVTIAEQVTIAVTVLKLSVNDAATVTDAASLSVSTLGGISVNDAVALTESVAARLSLLRMEVAENIGVGEGRDLAENPLRFAVGDAVLVGDGGTQLVGDRQPTPRIRGMFAWERWIRRES